MTHPRLSLNLATVRHASLRTALDVAVGAGIRAVGVWREPVAEVGLREATAMIAGSGLRVSSVCRGGFFTALDPGQRREALDDNRRAIDETAALAAAGAPGSAPVLVLVAGGLPSDDRDLAGARARVEDALTELEPIARAAGVMLGVEPLHPVYAADRAVVSTLAQALDLTAGFPRESVGVVVDAFHVWWDPDVFDVIARIGRQRRLVSYQVSDWMVPVAADVLLNRAFMGDGCIDLAPLTRAVGDAGYTGDVEVEIFNRVVWEDDPQQVAYEVSARFDAWVSL